MEKEPFLTIGIASYNYAAYLAKAFARIKAQQFTDFEVLYCDDGSTDESVSVIKQIIRENPGVRVRLVEGKNEGILANKNRILDNACGKYLMICDADDYMMDDCLQPLCRAALDKDADCVIGGFNEVDGNGALLKAHIPPENANKWLYIWHHIQIYKREILQKNKIRFFELPDDVCYLHQVHYYCQKVAFVNRALYCKVRHQDSTSSDFASNPDWHPAAIWGKVVTATLKIMAQTENKADRQALTYFLYKWFFFNIADLPEPKIVDLQKQIKIIRAHMLRACPDYRKCRRLIDAFQTGDTCFAKTAIAGCWFLEKLHLVAVIPKVRTAQRKLQFKK